MAVHLREWNSRMSRSCLGRSEGRRDNHVGMNEVKKKSQSKWRRKGKSIEDLRADLEEEEEGEELNLKRKKRMVSARREREGGTDKEYKCDDG